MPRRRFRSGGKPLHPTRWLGSGTMQSSTITGGYPVDASQTIITPAQFEVFTSPTIVRIRGDFTTLLRKVDSGAAESLYVSVGIMLLDDSIGTLPSLGTASGMEGPLMWFKYRRLWSHFNYYPMFTSAGAFTARQGGAASVADNTLWHQEIDIKAMRRVPQNTRLSLVYRVSAAQGTPEWDISGAFRVLVKE